MANQPTPEAGKRKSFVRTFFKWLCILLVTLFLVGLTTSAILCWYAATYIKDEIIPQVNSSTTNLLSGGTDLSSVIYYEKDGEFQPLQTLYANENRVWVTYDDIPQDLIHATVAIEDKRFYQHNGVDWKRTAAAAVYMFTGQRVQGGSTITQQLIKNLTRQDQVTVRRKVLEIFEALEFHRTHTEEEILEWYLNEIYLGRGCYGVKTAAQKYFGKELGSLDLAECAALISITNNPSLYDPYNHPENNLKRRKLVLDEMCEQGMISESQRDKSKAEELIFTSGSDNGSANAGSGEYYSWYTDAVIAQVISDLAAAYDYDEKTASQLVYSGGLKIYSCVNPDIQQQVDTVYTDVSKVQGYESQNGDQLQSAITVVDNNTGAVVALAGGMGEKVGNRIWNKATQTLRQPGSAMKPIGVYAQALEENLILPNTIIEDSPFMEVNGRAWPKNSHGGYSGNVDITFAMAQSLNTVAVKVLDEVGLEKSFDFLRNDLHLSTLVEQYTTGTGKVLNDIGYSQLALGGVTRGVSTYEMAGAYATFPRRGTYIQPYLYTAVVNSDGNALLTTEGFTAKTGADGETTITGRASGAPVFNDNTCFYMNELMTRVVTEGTGIGARVEGMSVAGKTGTTDDDYDRWFVGYTPYYTAAVWTGYDRASRIQASFNPACVLWRDVMTQVSAGQENVGFDDDYDYNYVEYCTKCGGVASSNTTSSNTMKFLQGDEPTYKCVCKKASTKKKK